MKILDVGEFGLIELIRKQTPRASGVRLGIGDDAAWVATRGDSLLVTSDLLIEGVHFNLDWISMEELGHKALTASLSDIAAMGGRPRYFLLSLALPGMNTKQVVALYKGVRTLAAEHRVALVGGDTCASDRMIIDVFLAGDAPYGVVTRSGATVGDDIYVTGTLGDSALGLALLAGSKRSASARDRAHLIRRHCRPRARVAAGMQLARSGVVRAMMDISDGLVQDLGHICTASRIGAVIWQEQVPLSTAFKRVAGARDRHYALSGGEDYELLFTATADHRKSVERLAKRTGIAITRIGRCERQTDGVRVVDAKDRRVPLPKGGYDHFRAQQRPVGHHDPGQ